MGWLIIHETVGVTEPVVAFVDTKFGSNGAQRSCRPVQRLVRLLNIPASE